MKFPIKWHTKEDIGRPNRRAERGGAYVGVSLFAPSALIHSPPLEVHSTLVAPEGWILLFSLQCLFESIPFPQLVNNM